MFMTPIWLENVSTLAGTCYYKEAKIQTQAVPGIMALLMSRPWLATNLYTAGTVQLSIVPLQRPIIPLHCGRIRL